MAFSSALLSINLRLLEAKEYSNVKLLERVYSITFAYVKPRNSLRLIGTSFEACLFGSWQAVEVIKIEEGTITLHFMDKGCVLMEKGPFSDLRIRSKKATLRDCSCVLRPGIDICVLSTSQTTDLSDENNVEHVWAVAKISSIQRKPHESECPCQFYINFYVNQGSLGTEVRTLTKEIKVVGINQISILQRLDVALVKISTIGGVHLRTVLLRFCVRSVGKKIVYQILGGELSPFCNSEGLRRWKSRNIPPERYLGCDDSPQLDVGFIRTRPYKIDPWKDDYIDDEVPLPLSCFCGLQVHCPERVVHHSEKDNKVNKPQELQLFCRKGESSEVKSGDAGQIQNEHHT
ncbi:hypothetical protein L6164_030125 [Bauhinia variegata]|uniref:Uncharacterized protein n=1 Tax=Bauhinia variegata TaxID=167791 RepID=A0ACB9LCN4_BAUVA|nr:hypothetical protein L6164_030125 [Bauhinia variegata]